MFNLLHFIKPDINPAWNFIIEYEVGRFGWIMQLAFLSLGFSCLCIVDALWKHLNVVGQINLQTTSGKLHSLGASLDQIPFAALLITISLFKKTNWKINIALLVPALISVWFAFVYFVVSVKAQFPTDGKFGRNVLVGWQNRIMIITQALWLILIAVQCKRKTTDQSQKMFISLTMNGR